MHKILLEKFGEPIGLTDCGVGVVDERDLVEIAPEGYENVIKKLKRNKKIDNPWAVAWALKNKSEK